MVKILFNLQYEAETNAEFEKRVQKNLDKFFKNIKNEDGHHVDYQDTETGRSVIAYKATTESDKPKKVGF